MKKFFFAATVLCTTPALAQNVDNEALRLLGSCVFTNSQSIQSGQAVERQLMATQQYWKEYIDGENRQLAEQAKFWSDWNQGYETRIAAFYDQTTRDQNNIKGLMAQNDELQQQLSREKELSKGLSERVTRLENEKHVLTNTPK